MVVEEFSGAVVKALVIFFSGLVAILCLAWIGARKTWF